MHHFGNCVCVMVMILSVISCVAQTPDRESIYVRGISFSHARRFCLRRSRPAPRKLNPLKISAIVPGSGVDRISPNTPSC